MNIQDIANHYKIHRDDESFVCIYNYIHRACRILATKWNAAFDTDIVHNIIVKIFDHIDKYDESTGKFSSWLFAIASNEYRQMFLKNSRKATDVAVEEIEFESGASTHWSTVQSYTPEYFPDNKLTEEDMEYAFEVLYPLFNPKTNDNGYALPVNIQKEIFYKSVVQQIRQEKIAAEYGITLSRVKLVVSRYRKYFIDFLTVNFPHKVIPEAVSKNRRQKTKSYKNI